MKLVKDYDYFSLGQNTLLIFVLCNIFINSNLMFEKNMKLRP